MATVLLVACLAQTALAFLLPASLPSSAAVGRRQSGASVQPLAVKRAGRRGGGGGSGGGSSGSGGGFGSSRGPGGRRGKDDGAEASKDPEKRLANLNRKLSSILEVCGCVDQGSKNRGGGAFRCLPGERGWGFVV